MNLPTHASTVAVIYASQSVSLASGPDAVAGGRRRRRGRV